jgi:hypothetical protein
MHFSVAFDGIVNIRVLATKQTLENLSSTTPSRAVEGTSSRALAEIKRLSAQEIRGGLLLGRRQVPVGACLLG